MSSRVAELGELPVSLSAGPCSVCGERCKGVTFNGVTRGPLNAVNGVLARVGVRCGCWDAFLRLVGDCLVCPD